jgi:hypothetical protein
MSTICIDLQSVAPIDLLHEMAERNTFGSNLPQPEPDQGLNVDLAGSTLSPREGGRIGLGLHLGRAFG